MVHLTARQRRQANAWLNGNMHQEHGPTLGGLRVKSGEKK
eukprot:CAMPEP_0177545676 /NCGR_PEP_ID=MMETSP0369-20130122/62757_1 /TAXON_ID=447022 ORGANISM="Scrippsiella hangoei-like, Strain SHHI-4" /NCGR_SAMPLE_ID=MMETSP0369 /ASSEMBLY_ACC=CAM_ASM_000364 /LENGTH=39 /DNA_ID= /DNA_START= /DNA_END= /DNA_ORIENTATION=